MSSIKQPVVWCSDPNSTNQKPTAFALHGIQFEGMITEQHVLALRELISAAAEGRLLLPSNGAIVLLDCGIDANTNTSNTIQSHTQWAEVQSKTIAPADPSRSDAALETSPTITAAQAPVKSANDHHFDVPCNVSMPIDIDSCDANVSNESKQLIECDANARKMLDTHAEPNKFEPKYSEFQVPALSKYDFIYEFLCCAKCINQQPANAFNEKQRMVNGVWSGKKSCRHRVIKNCDGAGRQQQQQSQRLLFNLEKNLYHLSGHINRSPVPLYATINTKSRKKNAIGQQKRQQHQPHGGEQTHQSQLVDGALPENALKPSDDDVACDSINIKIDTDDADAIASIGSPQQRTIEAETVMKLVPPIDDDEMQVPNLCALDPDTTVCNSHLKVANNSINASRKASFDSSCTVGSMDSGFIEMQNKLDASAKDVQLHTNECADSSTTTKGAMPTEIMATVHDSDIAEDDSMIAATTATTASPLPNQYEHSVKDNVLLRECSTQSRNRRKSYEEFKAIYHNRMTLESDLPFVQEHEHANNSLVSNKKEKIKARRKSYEEFKALVRECGTDDTNESKRKKSKQHTKMATKALSTMDETVGVDASIDETAAVVAEKKQQQSTKQEEQQRKPKKSSMKSTKSLANTTTLSNSCDALATTVPRVPNGVTTTASAKTKQDIYKANFKIYDKLISYGTIYDIMQKKTDIYKAYRKYDAYMTYGTIYEILQRKSDDNELFRRTRATSEKFINKRIGSSDDEKSAATAAKDDKSDKSRSLNFGTIYDIIQRKHRQSKKSNSLPNGVIGAIEMAKMSDAEAKANRRSRASDGCIYDIINQSKQCDEHSSVQSMTSTSSSSLSSLSSSIPSTSLSTLTLPPQQQQQHQQNVINKRFLVEKVNENDLSHTINQPAGSTSQSDDTKANTYTELTTEPIATSIQTSASAFTTPSTSLLAKWHSPRSNKVKKSNRMRRFSHILSYTQRLSHSECGPNADGLNPLKIPPCTESLPQTISEDVDSKVETSPNGLNGSAMNNNNSNPHQSACTNLKMTQTDFGQRNEVHTKKLNKLRKMSSPLPITQQQPPKIVPRKLSVPPPPLPPSSSSSSSTSLSFQQEQQSSSGTVKSFDNVSSNLNEHCPIKKCGNEHTTNENHSTIVGNDFNNDKNNNSNNNSGGKNDNCNQNDAGEHAQSLNESENNTKCKVSNGMASVAAAATTHCDGKLLRCKQIASIKSNTAMANELIKTTVKQRTTANDKKAKSRRLSEFTRGEFLNEKL